MKLGIVGAGYMGQAHARILSELANKYGHTLSFVVEPDEAKGKATSAKYGLKWYKSVEELLSEEGSGIVPFIASPTSTHLDMIDAFLSNGVEYIFVEKPLGDDLKKAEEISRKYSTSSLEKVMVGHIERFNPAYIELKKALYEDALGSLITVTSRRVGPFAVRIADVGVILDLAIHDIDLSIDLAGRLPERIISFYYYRYSTNHEDSCYIMFDYGSHIHTIEANRITPYKERKTILTGTNAVAQLDFIQQSLEVYTGKWKMERIVLKKEPLAVEDEEFLKSITSGNKAPLTYFEGLRNLQIAYRVLEEGKGNKV
ncbi:MAG: Gfo/Idh/MocA family oxidoreductase [Desulfurococcales archaeon]|uniref:Gfo/Idh/MocA family oxidoreductase n=1 Tax=Fervidicoccus fontis TaxID=683846 RepID=A0A7J3SLC6_9CREN